MAHEIRISGATGWFALAASAGTLVCCAIPILLVSVGMGAAVAAATSNFPALVVLSENKDYVFAGSAVLMAVSWWLHKRQLASCPADPELAAYCQKVKRLNDRLLWIAGSVWGIGFCVAYLALPLRSLLGF